MTARARAAQPGTQAPALDLVEVAVLAPVEGAFTYGVPAGMQVAPGTRVWVPFAGRGIEGVVLAVGVAAPSGIAVRAISRLVEGPKVDAPLIGLARWIADYYMAPLGEALRLVLPPGGRAAESAVLRLTDEGRRVSAALGQALLPPGLVAPPLRERAILERLVAADGDEKLRAITREVDGARAAIAELVKQGWVEVVDAVRVRKESARKKKAPVVEEEAGPVPAPPVLTPAQAAALAALAPSVEAGGYAGFLLHGATGSGKTEVYLRTIERALARGRGALVLVPEISLTPQLAARFRARFGDEVAVLHSNLSDRERFDAWGRLQAGKARIALGARSAVFASVVALGVVVVDEEHDGSFKQEDGLRYHARDVAMVRARDAGATAILGSATPSMETFEAARAGRLALLSLPERATASPLPSVQVVDLRQHRLEPGVPLAAPLLSALAETLAAKEQAILFLNRRGFATFVLCTGCGHRFSCRHCAVTLTWHRADDRLACHYCGYLEPTPQRCPKCQAQAVERLGLGTERVESIVAERFPGARVARLDRDTAQGQGLARILEQVRRHEVDVVVGTQMLAKGHDFPSVTLVGVVLADQGMNLPDFRSSERTFQLLAQVAGRAGRGARPGRVVIQTYTPEHPAVACAREHDFLRFFDEEREARAESGYPPFARLGIVRVDGADPAEVVRAAQAAARAARELAARAPAEARVEILGPAEAPLSRLKGKSRWQLLVKAASPRAVRAVLAAARAVEAPRGVRVSVDVDPVAML